MLRKLWETSRARALDRLVRNPRLASVIERYCLPRADRVLVVIEEAAVHARRLGVPESRLHVVSNTPHRSRALHDGQPRGSIDVAYLGIMEVDRGLVDTIDALALLAQRGMRVRARFVGAGRDLELLMNRAAAHGLGPDRLEFTGYVTGHARALELVAEARIGLLPHYATEWAETTIPNKLFDYMAAGIPVLSSDNTPCARILTATGAGRTFRAGDVTALADAVTDMLGDERELMKQGAAGKTAVLQRYNWEYDSAELLRAIELTVSAAPLPSRT
jgi:glycosyltransferase involved in cell wall biosynthesis